MPEINLLERYPQSKRSVAARGAAITEEVREISRRFGREYFDGDRCYGYGGYSYHPRFWQETVRLFHDHYALAEDASVLDVDGYIVLAGGASWVRSARASTKRAPIFVGVSAADPQTAGHSRAFAGALAGMGWPYRAEERNAGHMVDWAFMTHGIGWLRSHAHPSPSE